MSARGRLQPSNTPWSRTTRRYRRDVSSLLDVRSGGALIEEQESGTLERVLERMQRCPGSSPVNGSSCLCWSDAIDDHVRVGRGGVHMDFFTAQRLSGFAAMALITAPTAASFGCSRDRMPDRQQLGGTSASLS